MTAPPNTRASTNASSVVSPACVILQPLKPVRYIMDDAYLFGYGVCNIMQTSFLKWAMSMQVAAHALEHLMLTRVVLLPHALVKQQHIIVS